MAARNLLGNKTRRMNHASADHANVYSQVINHHGVRKVIMRAKSAIQPGEELRSDYTCGANARTRTKWQSKLVSHHK